MNPRARSRLSHLITNSNISLRPVDYRPDGHEPHFGEILMMGWYLALKAGPKGFKSLRDRKPTPNDDEFLELGLSLLNKELPSDQFLKLLSAEKKRHIQNRKTAFARTNKRLRSLTKAKARLLLSKTPFQPPEEVPVFCRRYFIFGLQLIEAGVPKREVSETLRIRKKALLQERERYLFAIETIMKGLHAKTPLPFFNLKSKALDIRQDL